MHLLSTAITLPSLGALAVVVLPRGREHLAKWVAAGTGLLTLLVTLAVAGAFQVGVAGMQLEERAPWIPSLGVSYHLGVDGLGLALLLLSALLSFVAVLGSWHVSLRPRAYFSLLLLLESSLLGVFVSLDYVLFYIFWEVVLVPMYFLIGIWGGPRREYAALKFFLYTLTGSVIMLVGVLTLYFASGATTFDMLELARVQYAPEVQKWVFLAFFFGFAVKVPIFPLHTWLPDAHVEAPTAVSVLLAGALLKMGTYGFVRISLPTLPLAAQHYAPLLAWLGVINILYGGLAAMAQSDLKRMVAYSSISHMGYVILGISAGTTLSLSGASFQMISHGLVAASMFLLVGMVYERTHTREIPGLRGLFLRVPTLAAVMAFASFASLGLPGLSGFVGEFLVLVGSYTKLRSFTLAALSGLVLGAGYLLWMMQRVLLGKDEEAASLPDLSWRELATLVPLGVLILTLGVNPGLLLRLFDPSLTALAAYLGGGR
jgi:NADH-quinone oxidoreductase subunit M